MYLYDNLQNRAGELLLFQKCLSIYIFLLLRVRAELRLFQIRSLRYMFDLQFAPWTGFNIRSIRHLTELYIMYPGLRSKKL